ncbi:MAG: AarF/ABC1/UbiB kinase family protein [Pseudomonadota bacterium]
MVNDKKKEKKQEDIVSSSISRLYSVSSLVGTVGLSILGNKTLDIFRNSESVEKHKIENLVNNAQRIAETLGRLKGGAMKVGQMLSLQDSLMPPEVAKILSLLQSQAPAVPFEKMKVLVKKDLKEKFSEIEWIDEEAYAAASIGQIHKARLRDGREVALKIQYPDIDKVIKADLKNLKGIFKSLIGLFMKVNFEPIWKELQARLLEELDYEREASSVEKVATFFADSHEVVIPRVIKELSTKHVLTMELLVGISGQDACSGAYGQELKNKWSKALFRFVFESFFVHRFLHADPNLANFAFLEDGRIIVYDFGCVKTIPEKLLPHLKDFTSSVLKSDVEALPPYLKKIGIYIYGGNEVSQELVNDFFTPFEKMSTSGEYTFNENKEIIQQMIKLKTKHFLEISKFQFPRDIVFIDRTLAGHFGNLGKFNASGTFREMLLNIINK